MIKDKYLRYSHGYVVDGSSIAATWIWAPAIFISYQVSVTYGLIGALLFIIPNAATLPIYGYVAGKLRKNMEGYTVGDIIRARAGKVQYRINISVTVLLLIFSCVAQLTGLVLILGKYLSLSNGQIAALVSAVCFLYTFRHGLRSSVLSDFIKYLAMFLCGGFLVWHVLSSAPDIAILSPASFDVRQCLLDFGIIMAANWLVALYPDQTFWQRTFSIKPARVFKTYLTGGILFALIPTFFAVMALVNAANGVMDKDVSAAISAWPYNMVLLVVVVGALLSTLDSNLCAVSSLVWHEFGLSDKSGRAAGMASMAVALLLANGVYAAGIPLLPLQLIYSTIRSSVGLGIVLMILDRFDARRLFALTLFSVFALVPLFVCLKLANYEYCFVVSLLVVVLPALSFRKSRGHV